MKSDDLRDFYIALNRIESHEYSAYVNSASGLKFAIRLITIHPDTQLLTARCMRHRHLINILLQQIRTLCNSSSDPAYEFPWDCALATLLLILNSLDPVAATFAATMVQRAPQLSWAGKVARIIASEEITRARQSADQNVNLAVEADRTWPEIPSSAFGKSSSLGTGDTRPLLAIKGMSSDDISFAAGVVPSMNQDQGALTGNLVKRMSGFGAAPLPSGVHHVGFVRIQSDSGPSRRFQVTT